MTPSAGDRNFQGDDDSKGDAEEQQPLCLPSAESQVKIRRLNVKDGGGPPKIWSTTSGKFKQSV